MFPILSRLSTVLLLWDLAATKPLPDLELQIEHSDEYHPEVETNLTRVDRSLSDYDAVNPNYFDAESQPDQEAPQDPQEVISSFALKDHVSNLFRSHKPGNKGHMSPPRAVPGERAVSIVEEDLDHLGLQSDEQEECYRQQNIDPPWADSSSLTNRHKPRAVSTVDFARGRDPSFVRSEVLKERGGRFYVPKEEDKSLIHSLYTDPERIVKTKKLQRYHNFDAYETSDNHSRVYKPVGVAAQFPVYDDDIAFHPDPLHGILDDKYWTDPQAQEEVIKKYVNLAANNMMPVGVQYEKRSVDKNKVKSDTGFRDEGCSRKDVVACGECSKGKNQKKSNHSAYSCGDSSGRKLLSLDKGGRQMSIEEANEENQYESNAILSGNKKEYDGIDKGKSDGMFQDKHVLSGEYGNYIEPGEREEDETQMYKVVGSFVGRKLLSVEHDDMDEYEDHVGCFTGMGDFENTNIRRNLLSYYDGNDNSYYDSFQDVQDIPNQHTEGVQESRYIIKDTSSHGLGNKIPVEVLPDGQGSEYPKKVYEQVDSSGNNFNRYFNLNKNQFYEIPNSVPRFYKPNRLTNILQKPLKEKPKGTPKPKKTTTTIDPSREFEKIINETFKNISLDESEKFSNQSEVHNGNSKLYNRPILTFKERRRQAKLPINNELPLLDFFQNLDNQPVQTSNEKNKVANFSEHIQNLDSFPIQFNQNGPNAVSEKVTGHATRSPSVSPADMYKPRSRSDDEDVVDARIANSIVDSVISDVAKSSVVGHSLGLSRNNESNKNSTVLPETERLLKSVTDCIMKRLRNHLAKQSCLLLDSELLEFLKWLILRGEYHRDYSPKMDGKFYALPKPTPEPSSAAPPKAPAVPHPDGKFPPPETHTHKAVHKPTHAPDLKHATVCVPAHPHPRFRRNT